MRKIILGLILFSSLSAFSWHKDHGDHEDHGKHEEHEEHEEPKEPKEIVCGMEVDRTWKATKGTTRRSIKALLSFLREAKFIQSCTNSNGVVAVIYRVEDREYDTESIDAAILPSD